MSGARATGASAATEGPRLGWRELAPILVVHVCGTLGFSIGLPILVFLVDDLGGAPWTYGLLGATYSGAQMIGAPILGRWSDRSGRKRVLAVSQAGTVAAWILFLIALRAPDRAFGEFAGTTLTLPLGLVFLARFLDGLTGGNISVASAYVADITKDAKASRQIAFGRMGMAASVGFTAGPALAGFLASGEDPYTGPVLAAAAIALVGVVLCLRLQDPEGPCPSGPPEQGALSKALSQQQLRCDKRAEGSGAPSRLATPLVRLALVLTFVMYLGFNIYYAAFPVHATERIGWDPAGMGLFYASMSAAMFVTQGPLLGVAAGRLRPRGVLALGLAGLAVSFLAFPASTGFAAYLGGSLFALGNGFAWPTFQARTASLVPETEQGALQGRLSSAGSLASIAGLILGGALYPWLGGSVFLASSVLFGGVFFASRRLYRSASTAGEPQASS